MFSAIGGTIVGALYFKSFKAWRFIVSNTAGPAAYVVDFLPLGERSLRYDVPIFVPLRTSITDYALAAPHSRIPECILDRTKPPLGIQ
jgi:hypothetical protein